MHDEGDEMVTVPAANMRGRFEMARRSDKVVR